MPAEQQSPSVRPGARARLRVVAGTAYQACGKPPPGLCALAGATWRRLVDELRDLGPLQARDEPVITDLARYGADLEILQHDAARQRCAVGAAEALAEAAEEYARLLEQTRAMIAARGTGA